MEDPASWAWGWKKKRAMRDPRSRRFLTFSCEKRWPLFHRAATRDAFVAALEAAEAAGSLRVLAFVVMPEHVHLLVEPGADGTPLAAAVAKLKASFARDTLRLWAEGRPEALRKLTRKDGSRRFWMRGTGYDRWMQDEDDCREKAAYTHGNPVRRGLVERATAYRWSSAWGGWGVWAEPPVPPPPGGDGLEDRSSSPPSGGGTQTG